MENKQIVYIGTDHIFPHPDNPRKDLGDLSELADSIKANGILQNLTVVPQQPGYCTSCSLYIGSVGKCEKDYDESERPPCSKWESKENFTAVIGHRRLAAAKLAGLTEVPCVISDMSHGDQVRTMLMENIQRSDLTVYEQAQGFQMMLNMGDNVKDISQKSGFSESTVRRRVKLLDLDPDAFKKSVTRGGTLDDFAKLDEIQNPERKNEVLKSVGTANFNNALHQAIEDEKWETRVNNYREFLSTFAEEIDERPSGVTYCGCRYRYNESQPFDMPDDTATRKYYFMIKSSYVELYADPVEQDTTPCEKTDEQLQREAAEKALQERRAALIEAGNRAFALRHEFMQGYVKKSKHRPAILSFAANTIFDATYLDLSEVAEFLGTSPPENSDDDAEVVCRKMINEKLQEDPESTLAKIAYMGLGDCASDSYSSWSMIYAENPELDGLYRHLCELGYEMSDEEKALQDGTHELFEKQEQQDNE